MSESNVKFGQGGRLYADATRESDGLPWDHVGGEERQSTSPTRVLPKSPAGLPPASSARPGSFRSTSSTILEIAGLVSVATGFFLFSPALGLIVAGLAMVLVGYAVDGGVR